MTGQAWTRAGARLDPPFQTHGRRALNQTLTSWLFTLPSAGPCDRGNPRHSVGRGGRSPRVAWTVEVAHCVQMVDEKLTGARRLKAPARARAWSRRCPAGAGRRGGHATIEAAQMELHCHRIVRGAREPAQLPPGRARQRQAPGAMPERRCADRAQGPSDRARSAQNGVDCIRWCPQRQPRPAPRLSGGALIGLNDLRIVRAAHKTRSTAIRSCPQRQPRPSPRLRGDAQIGLNCTRSGQIGLDCHLLVTAARRVTRRRAARAGSAPPPRSP